MSDMLESLDVLLLEMRHSELTHNLLRQKDDLILSHLLHIV